MLVKLETDDCNETTWLLSLSFSCLKKAIVVWSPADELELDLNETIC